MADQNQIDLKDAVAKLQAARDALLPFLDARNGELAPIADRLDRIAGEVARIERVIAEQTVTVRE
jgi:predicted nuclease with TOPRIM domain